ncbi:LysR family transcriptional regulator [Cupriavidus pauculus]|uniref:LysR family transcriptional regulator n=1 Tax=Cupriavidus pauculus TaxID=82633 RepID=A0A5P2HAP0_9BURK|nr:LysR family transcriptional regulator [Cupriavidus pauculus]QET05287.1 LysR family transcriptional regulator [Cupriavidus pauculus]
MDKLGSVDAFVKAAEIRNFSEVGRQLGISASAVGKAISRLEQRLGVRLFHRSTRSITLTPEGQLFLSRCQRIVEELEAAEAELSAASSPKGQLRVSLPLVGALLLPVLSSFIREYPDIRLELDFSDRMVNIIDEGFDVVLRTGDAADSRLVTRALGYYTPQIVAAPAYLSRRGVPASPDDLLRHACLLHRYPSTGKVDRWLLREGDNVREMDLPALLTVNTVEPLIEMAEQGHGLAYIPNFLVRRQLEDGRLVTVLSDYATDRKVFRAVWPSGRHMSPKIRVFVDYMARHLFPDEGSRTEIVPAKASA